MLRDATFRDAEPLAPEAETAFVMGEDEFRAFYDRSARGVWAYLARVTGDRQVADDLLQEAYYRFLRAASVYESEHHQRNALYKIATNLALDHRRRLSIRPVATVVGEDVERISGGVVPGKGMELDQAMARLRPKERAMLWLAYAEGATHEEIAANLGLRLSSMKGLLFRARKRFAQLLGGEVKR